MLKQSVIENVLNAALETGGDFAEIFVEDKISNSLLLVSGVVEKSLSGRSFGVGIRIFKDLFSVYAYTNDNSEENLIKTAKKAASAISGTREDITINLIKQDIENNNKIIKMPTDIAKNEKITILKKANDAAINYDDEITQVKISYGDYIQNVMIANSEGKWVEDQRVRGRMYITSIASKGTEMQTGGFGPGAHKGFEFLENLDVESYAKEASRSAKTMLNAQYCPSGQMPVVIDNGFGGVIFHEACGHGLEATAIAKGTSVFCGKLGQQVASPLVTAYDDGTIANEWGSTNVDDEGNPTQKNLLIEKGILKGYLIDKLNGRRMKMAATGSSRRESYKYAPTSRMTNTFIDNGESNLEDIIANTENGLYAKYMGGGSVDPSTGDFNFAVTEGYLIKNGKIDKPVKGATLIGNGAKTLMDVDMVGNNLEQAQGMCGSISGSIEANVGQPAIRVKKITVGGRS